MFLFRGLIARNGFLNLIVVFLVTHPLIFLRDCKVPPCQVFRKIWLLSFQRKIVNHDFFFSDRNLRSSFEDVAVGTKFSLCSLEV